MPSLLEQQLEQGLVAVHLHVEEPGIEEGEGLLSVADMGESWAQG